MRLFLSSQDFGKHPDVLFKMVGKNKRVGFIPNAQDDQPEYRDQTIVSKLDECSAIGLEPELLDLRKYFGKPDELKEKLTEYGLVWARGGNTFILRRAMAASGFDVIIKQMLGEDRIVYGGSSAGSCVAAESLEGIDRGDRPSPEDVPTEYPNKEAIWQGLGLVPFMVVPHCDSDWFAEKAKKTIEYLEKNGLPFRALNDGQVIVIDGDKEEFLK